MESLKEFYLRRIEDESGVSGVGIVARGVVLSSGHCCLEWLTFTSSIGIYKSVQDLEAIHGHNGKTLIEWGTPSTPKKGKKK